MCEKMMTAAFESIIYIVTNCVTIKLNEMRDNQSKIEARDSKIATEGGA